MRFITACFFVLFALAVRADVIYVDIDNGGSQDGSSWATAYTSIPAAISAAGVGDTLWVAEGVYEAPESATWVTITDELHLYGGFEGDEVSVTDRNVLLHETVFTFEASETTAAEIAFSTPTPPDTYEVTFNSISFRDRDLEDDDQRLFSVPLGVTLVLNQCFFDDCDSFLFNVSGGDLDVCNTIIEGTSTNTDPAPLLDLDSGSARFHNCVIINNDDQDGVGLMSLATGQTFDVRNTIFWNNGVSSGTGVTLADYAEYIDSFRNSILTSDMSFYQDGAQSDTLLFLPSDVADPYKFWRHEGATLTDWTLESLVSGDTNPARENGTATGLISQTLSGDFYNNDREVETIDVGATEFFGSFTNFVANPRFGASSPRVSLDLSDEDTVDADADTIDVDYQDMFGDQSRVYFETAVDSTLPDPLRKGVPYYLREISVDSTVATYELYVDETFDNGGTLVDLLDDGDGTAYILTGIPFQEELITNSEGFDADTDRVLLNSGFWENDTEVAFQTISGALPTGLSSSRQYYLSDKEDYQYWFSFLEDGVELDLAEDLPSVTFTVTETPADVVEVMTADQYEVSGNQIVLQDLGWEDGDTVDVSWAGSSPFDDGGVSPRSLTLSKGPARNHTFRTRLDVGGTEVDLSDQGSGTTMISYRNPPIGLFVNFTDLTTPPNGFTTTSWAWDFDSDGTVDSTEQNPSYTYPREGLYTPTLEVTMTDDGGELPDVVEEVYKTDYIKVAKAAVFLEADFTSDHRGGFAPHSVSFYNTTRSSEVSIDYEWDFGDGSTSTILSPSHTFEDSGIYTVTLTASYFGKLDKEIKKDYIIVPERLTPQFSADAQVLIYPDVDLNLFDESQVLTKHGDGSDTIDTWAWDVLEDTAGSVNTSSVQNPSITVDHIQSGNANDREYDIELTVDTVGGLSESVTYESFLKVLSPVKPGLSVSTNFARPGSSFYFQNDSLSRTSTSKFNPTTVSWDVLDHDTQISIYDPDPAPSFAYDQRVSDEVVIEDVGTYDVVMTITGEVNGGPSTTTVTLTEENFIVVGEGFSDSLNATPRLGVIPLKVDFKDNSFRGEINPPSTWVWNYGDGGGNVWKDLAQFDGFSAPELSIVPVYDQFDPLSGAPSGAEKYIELGSRTGMYAFEGTYVDSDIIIPPSYGESANTAELPVLASLGYDPDNRTYSPSYIYKAPGVFSIDLLSDRNRILKPDFVEAVPPLDADFSAIGRFVIGEGVVQFVPNLVKYVSDLHPVEYEWTFPGGDPETSVSSHPLVTYSDSDLALSTYPQTFDVSLKVKIGDWAHTVVKQDLIHVQPAVFGVVNHQVASIDGTPPDETYDVQLSSDVFLRRSYDTISAYDWDYGDENTETLTTGLGLVVHTYEDEGTFTPTLTVTTSSDGVERLINSSVARKDSSVWGHAEFSLGNGPKADVVVSPSRGVVPFVVTALNQSIPVEGQFSSISWSLSDHGDFSWKRGDFNSRNVRSASWSIETPGVYDLILEVEDDSGLTATEWRQIEAYPARNPKAEFSVMRANRDVNLPGRGIIPFQVKFFDQSLSGSAPIDRWLWEFGDGSTSTERNPIHTYFIAGDYTVRLSVFSELPDGSELSNTLAKEAVVQAKTLPISNFEYEYVPGEFVGSERVFLVWEDASGEEENGKTWKTAFTTIQEGIDAAEDFGGGEVWVAGGQYGVYEELSELIGSIPSDELSSTSLTDLITGFEPESFNTVPSPIEGEDWTCVAHVPDGVDLYGGFDPADFVFEDRDPVRNKTVINGFLLNYDEKSNASPVVAFSGNSIFEGFTIIGGMCTDDRFPVGGGVCQIADPLTTSKTLRVKNCDFLFNTSTRYGGGLGVVNSRTVVDNCTFKNNFCAIGGSAVAGVPYGVDDTYLQVTNSVFDRNSSLVFEDRIFGDFQYLAPKVISWLKVDSNNVRFSEALTHFFAFHIGGDGSNQYRKALIFIQDYTKNEDYVFKDLDGSEISLATVAYALRDEYGRTEFLSYEPMSDTTGFCVITPSILDLLANALRENITVQFGAFINVVGDPVVAFDELDTRPFDSFAYVVGDQTEDFDLDTVSSLILGDQELDLPFQAAEEMSLGLSAYPDIEVSQETVTLWGDFSNAVDNVYDPGSVGLYMMNGGSPDTGVDTLFPNTLVFSEKALVADIPGTIISHNFAAMPSPKVLEKEVYVYGEIDGEGHYSNILSLLFYKKDVSELTPYEVVLGAVISTGLKSDFSNCEFTNNFSGMLGGGIGATSDMKISDCVFTDNLALSGAALACAPTGDAYPPFKMTVSNSQFFRNRVEGFFGGAYSSVWNNFTDPYYFEEDPPADGSSGIFPGTTIGFTNCFFSENSARSTGAAMSINDSSPHDIFHCTFLNNKTDIFEPHNSDPYKNTSLFFRAESAQEIRNSIIWSDTEGDELNLELPIKIASPGGLTVKNSVIKGVTDSIEDLANVTFTQVTASDPDFSKNYPPLSFQLQDADGSLVDILDSGSRFFEKLTFPSSSGIQALFPIQQGVRLSSPFWEEGQLLSVYRDPTETGGIPSTFPDTPLWIHKHRVEIDPSPFPGQSPYQGMARLSSTYGGWLPTGLYPTKEYFPNDPAVLHPAYFTYEVHEVGGSQVDFGSDSLSDHEADPFFQVDSLAGATTTQVDVSTDTLTFASAYATPFFETDRVEEDVRIRFAVVSGTLPDADDGSGAIPLTGNTFFVTNLTDLGGGSYSFELANSEGTGYDLDDGWSDTVTFNLYRTYAPNDVWVFGDFDTILLDDPDYRLDYAAENSIEVLFGDDSWLVSEAYVTETTRYELVVDRSSFQPTKTQTYMLGTGTVPGSVEWENQVPSVAYSLKETAMGSTVDLTSDGYNFAVHTQDIQDVDLTVEVDTVLNSILFDTFYSGDDLVFWTDDALPTGLTQNTLYEIERRIGSESPYFYTLTEKDGTTEIDLTDTGSGIMDVFSNYSVISFNDSSFWKPDDDLVIFTGSAWDDDDEIVFYNEDDLLPDLEGGVQIESGEKYVLKNKDYYDRPYSFKVSKSSISYVPFELSDLGSDPFAIFYSKASFDSSAIDTVNDFIGLTYDDDVENGDLVLFIQYPTTYDIPNGTVQGQAYVVGDKQVHSVAPGVTHEFKLYHPNDLDNAIDLTAPAVDYALALPISEMRGPQDIATGGGETSLFVTFPSWPLGNKLVVFGAQDIATDDLPTPLDFGASGYYARTFKTELYSYSFTLETPDATPVVFGDLPELPPELTQSTTTIFSKEETVTLGSVIDIDNDRIVLSDLSGANEADLVQFLPKSGTLPEGIQEQRRYSLVNFDAPTNSFQLTDYLFTPDTVDNFDEQDYIIDLKNNGSGIMNVSLFSYSLKLSPEVVPNTYDGPSVLQNTVYLDYGATANRENEFTPHLETISPSVEWYPPLEHNPEDGEEVQFQWWDDEDVSFHANGAVTTKATGPGGITEGQIYVIRSVDPAYLNNFSLETLAGNPVTITSSGSGMDLEGTTLNAPGMMYAFHRWITVDLDSVDLSANPITPIEDIVPNSAKTALTEFFIADPDVYWTIPSYLPVPVVLEGSDLPAPLVAGEVYTLVSSGGGILFLESTPRGDLRKSSFDPITITDAGSGEMKVWLPWDVVPLGNPVNQTEDTILFQKNDLHDPSLGNPSIRLFPRSNLMPLVPDSVFSDVTQPKDIHFAHQYEKTSIVRLGDDNQFDFTNDEITMYEQDWNIGDEIQFIPGPESEIPDILDSYKSYWIVGKRTETFPFINIRIAETPWKDPFTFNAGDEGTGFMYMVRVSKGSETVYFNQDTVDLIGNRLRLHRPVWSEMPLDINEFGKISGTSFLLSSFFRVEYPYPLFTGRGYFLLNDTDMPRSSLFHLYDPVAFQTLNEMLSPNPRLLPERPLDLRLSEGDGVAFISDSLFTPAFADWEGQQRVLVESIRTDRSIFSSIDPDTDRITFYRNGWDEGMTVFFGSNTEEDDDFHTMFDAATPPGIRPGVPYTLVNVEKSSSSYDPRIGENSSAIDIGSYAGSYRDIDNEKRPQGNGFDAGVDEFTTDSGSRLGEGEGYVFVADELGDLYRVNIETGQLAGYIGRFKKQPDDLLFDERGRLLAVFDNALYRVNLRDADTYYVGNLKQLIDEEEIGRELASTSYAIAPDGTFFGLGGGPLDATDGTDGAIRMYSTYTGKLTDAIPLTFDKDGERLWTPVSSDNSLAVIIRPSALTPVPESSFPVENMSVKFPYFFLVAGVESESNTLVYALNYVTNRYDQLYATPETIPGNWSVVSSLDNPQYVVLPWANPPLVDLFQSKEGSEAKVVFDQFSNTPVVISNSSTEDKCLVEWYGLFRNNGSSGSECLPDDAVFHIKFYNLASYALPEPGDLVADITTGAYDLTTETYVPDGGSSDEGSVVRICQDQDNCGTVFQFRFELDADHGTGSYQDVAASNWISIQAEESDNCLFFWAAGAVDSGTAYLGDGSSTGKDMAFALQWDEAEESSESALTNTILISDVIEGIGGFFTDSKDRLIVYSNDDESFHQLIYAPDRLEDRRISPISSIPSGDLVFASIYEAGAERETQYSFPVKFGDLSLPGNAVIRGWLWDFGDGSYSSERNPVHQFRWPGRYDVTLGVLTDVGQDLHTQQIEVGGLGFEVENYQTLRIRRFGRANATAPYVEGSGGIVYARDLDDAEGAFIRISDSVYLFTDQIETVSQNSAAWDFDYFERTDQSGQFATSPMEVSVNENLEVHAYFTGVANTRDFSMTRSHSQYYACDGDVYLDVTLNLKSNVDLSLDILSHRENLPAGWTFDSVQSLSSGALSTSPDPGDNVLDFVWGTKPTFPATLTYRIDIPANESGKHSIRGSAFYQFNGGGFFTYGPVTTYLDDNCEATGEISYPLTVTIYPPEVSIGSSAFPGSFSLSNSGGSTLTPTGGSELLYYEGFINQDGEIDLVVDDTDDGGDYDNDCFEFKEIRTSAGSVLLSSPSVSLSDYAVTGPLSLIVEFENAAPNAIAITSDTVCLDDVSGEVTIAVEDIDDGSNDPGDCGGITMWVVPDTLDCSDIGSGNIITLYVQDEAGNVATDTCDITVQDCTDPTVTTDDITVDLDDATVEVEPEDLFTDVPFDNCTTLGNLTLEIKKSGGSYASSITYDCTELGVNNVVTKITDEEGNYTEYNNTVTVQEGTYACLLAVCEDLSVIELTSTSTAITLADVDRNNGTGSIGDGDSRGYLSYTISPSSVGCADLGTPVDITFTVYSGAGQTGDSAFCVIENVNVSDPVDYCSQTVGFPVAICQNITAAVGDTITPAMIDGGSYIPGGGAFTLDIVEGNPTFTCGDLGVQVYTLRITDNGDSDTDTCTANITVIDDTPPVLTMNDLEINLEADGDIDLTGAMGPFLNSVSDDCATLDIDDLTYDRSLIFTCDDLGENIVTASVSDGYNVTQTPFTITVNEGDARCGTYALVIRLADTSPTYDVWDSVTLQHTAYNTDLGTEETLSMADQSTKIFVLSESVKGPNVALVPDPDVAYPAGGYWIPPDPVTVEWQEVDGIYIGDVTFTYKPSATGYGSITANFTVDRSVFTKAYHMEGEEANYSVDLPGDAPYAVPGGNYYGEDWRASAYRMRNLSTGAAFGSWTPFPVSVPAKTATTVTRQYSMTDSGFGLTSWGIFEIELSLPTGSWTVDLSVYDQNGDSNPDGVVIPPDSPDEPYRAYVLVDSYSERINIDMIRKVSLFKGIVDTGRTNLGPYFTNCCECYLMPYLNPNLWEVRVSNPQKARALGNQVMIVPAGYIYDDLPALAPHALDCPILGSPPECAGYPFCPADYWLQIFEWWDWYWLDWEFYGDLCITGPTPPLGYDGFAWGVDMWVSGGVTDGMTWGCTDDSESTCDYTLGKPGVGGTCWNITCGTPESECGECSLQFVDLCFPYASMACFPEFNTSFYSFYLTSPDFSGIQAALAAWCP